MDLHRNALFVAVNDIILRTGAAADIQLGADIDLGGKEHPVADLFHHSFIIGITQVDPVFTVTPPGGFAQDGSFFNEDLCTRSSAALCCAISRAGACIVLRTFSSNRNFYAGGLCRLCRAVIGKPMGIQSHAIGIRIQNGDLFTAVLLRVPTFKYVTFSGGYRSNRDGNIRVVSLHQIILGFTAVELKQGPAVVCRCGTAIDTVEIHIGIAAAAAKLTGGIITVGLAPQHKGVDQLIAGCTVGDGHMENAVSIRCPGRAYIVREQHQRIQLILGQLQTVLISKAVDGFFKFGGMLPEHLLALFFGDGIFGIVAHFIIRTKRTVADGVMLEIPIRLSFKAFVFFQNINGSLTEGIPDGFFLSCLSSRCVEKEDAQHQRSRYDKTGDPLLHRVCSFHW